MMNETNNYFAVDKDTGKVTVKSNIDREQVPSMQLKVIVFYLIM